MHGSDSFKRVVEETLIVHTLEELEKIFGEEARALVKQSMLTTL